MNDIAQARTILAKWRKEATQDAWWIDGKSEGYVEVSAGQVGWEVISDRHESCAIPPVSFPDARLIVGTAGNPDLLDAIDAMLNDAQHYRPGNIWNPMMRHAQRIAAAIIAADTRMGRDEA